MTNKKMPSPQYPFGESKMLLIPSKCGRCWYSRRFSEDVTLESDQLIANFLTTLNMVPEILLPNSQLNIEQVRFEKGLILTRRASHSVVFFYLHGESSLALARLSTFIAELQKTPSIWQEIHHAIRTGRVLSPRTKDAIDKIVDRIFRL